MKRKWIVNPGMLFLVLAVSGVLMTGCGNAKKESGAIGTGGVQVVGFSACYKCHADSKNPASFPTVFGDTAASIAASIGWLNGPHGNNETFSFTTFTESDIRPSNTGFPYYGYFSDDTCKTCHDPLDEGKTIAKFFTQSGDSTLGMVDRPVIGCESCHGGGGNHFGVGPLPFAKPDADRCGQCHSAAFPDAHLHYHPEGDRIIEDYSTSKHASSINSHNYVTSNDPASGVQARCSRCHTDEGARLYVPVSSGTMTYDQLKTATANLPNLTEANNVQCRTCHDGHNPLKLLGDEDAGAPGTWSEEFKTCTACHQLLKADGTLNDETYHTLYSKAGTTLNAYGSFEEVIGDTHYDDPATDAIEGYVVNPASNHSGLEKNTNSGTCRDCHNPHNADNRINSQWARSGHAGEILEVKEAALAAGTSVYAAGTTALPFVEDDFKTLTCGAQRCHSSTGFRAYANDPASYASTTTMNVSSQFIATGLQRELLYCWACHTSNVGNLRNPGAVASSYPMTGETTTFLFPDASGSNICISCHMGRSGGANIANGIANDGTTIVFTNKSLRTPHHAVAAGVLYKTIGYEFSGATGTYANKSYFEHDQIGTSAVANTGTNGPCAGCHMISAETHLFSPVKKNASGTITELTGTVCATCHTQYPMNVTVLEEQASGIDAALHALDAQLQLRNYFFKWADPGFYTTDTYGTSVTNWTTSGIDATGKNTMGSAFNLYMLVNDAGAYAHNRYYAKRLIYDSIDFLDDGTLNASTGATLTTACSGGTPPTWCTAAMGWLFSTLTGTARP